MTDQHVKAPASDYDEFVNWDKRLASEGPFFKDIFEREGTARVLDVGAGSARHALMFATWGLEVVAVDPDESMLAQATQNLDRFSDEIVAAGGSIHLGVGEFGHLRDLYLEKYDAITCLGNALPHVAGRDGLTEALADMSQMLMPGGVLILHLLNHQRLLEKRPRVVPPKVVDTARGTTKVFVRVIDYPPGDEYLDFDFVTLERGLNGEWSATNRRSPHTAIPLSVLESELSCTGFGDIEAFGGHDKHAVTPNDESIIVVAKRR